VLRVNLGNADTEFSAIDNTLDLTGNADTEPRFAQVANTIENLGVIFAQQSKYDLSLSKLQEALDVRIMALGADHMDVSSTQYKVSPQLQSKKNSILGHLPRQCMADPTHTVSGAQHTAWDSKARRHHPHPRAHFSDQLLLQKERERPC